MTFIRYSTPVTPRAVSSRLTKTIVCGISIAFAVMAFRPVRASGDRDNPQKAGQMEGAKIYADNCTECHAPDGHGLMLHQPNFTDPDWQKTVTDAELSKVIKWGREPMPFWVGSLTDEQINAVVSFIRTLSQTAAANGASRANVGSTANRSPVEGPLPGSPIIGAAASDTCSACHQKQDEKILALYSQSAHAKAGKGCNGCHGGDPAAATKEDAHSLNFVGKPTSDQAIRMCGSCHRQEAAQYRASHHFPAQKEVSRVDCVQCHGAHTVGAPARGYSVAYFCSGCHGLEYLPGLQQQFQDMLKLSDDLRQAVQGLADAGHPPSDEISKRRKEIQQLTGEIVHKTDLEGGTARIPHILELGEKLKTMIESSGKGSR